MAATLVHYLLSLDLEGPAHLAIPPDQTSIPCLGHNAVAEAHRQEVFNLKPENQGTRQPRVRNVHAQPGSVSKTKHPRMAKLCSEIAGNGPPQITLKRNDDILAAVLEPLINALDDQSPAIEEFLEELSRRIDALNARAQERVLTHLETDLSGWIRDGVGELINWVLRQPIFKPRATLVVPRTSNFYHSSSMTKGATDFALVQEKLRSIFELKPSETTCVAHFGKIEGTVTISFDSTGTITCSYISLGAAEALLQTWSQGHVNGVSTGSYGSLDNICVMHHATPLAMEMSPPVPSHGIKVEVNNVEYTVRPFAVILAMAFQEPDSTPLYPQDAAQALLKPPSLSKSSKAN